MTLRTTRAARETLYLVVPHLYREELETIARIVEDECDDLRIEFHDDRGRVGDTSGAFAEYHQAATEEVLKWLTITGMRGEVKLTVAFTPIEVELTLINPDNSARGAANQIRNLCWEHRRVASRAPMDMGSVQAFRLGAAACVIAPIIPIQMGMDSPTLPLALAAVGATLLVSAAITPLTRRPLLINAPRSERPPWLKRHGKDVLLLFVGGCVGYAVNQMPAAVNLLGG